jgi:Skp family chaperone for outer membrane proteins
MKITVKKVHELEKVFSGKIEVLTEKGSKAGEDRRLKALSQTPDVFDQSIDIDENASDLVLEFKNKTGLNIRLTEQYIHELKELLLNRNEEAEKKAKEALDKQQKLQEEENRNLKAAEHKRNNAEREAFNKAEQETTANESIKQKHSVASISEGFQKLIDSCLADGKLTKEEREVLLNRAEIDGLDQGEFMVHLDALLHIKKKTLRHSSEPFLKKTIYHRPEGYRKQEIQPGALDTFKGALSGGVKKKYEDVYKKEINFRVYHLMMILVGVLGILVIIFSSISSYQKGQGDLIAKYGCTSFDDCLSQYQFDGAYHFYSSSYESQKQEQLRKLISAQVTFWSDKNDYQKAYSILSEYTFEHSPKLSTDDKSANDNYNTEASFYNDQINELVAKMKIADEPLELILKYAKLFKPIVIGNENDKGFFGGFNSYVLSEQPYEKALEKIND